MQTIHVDDPSIEEFITKVVYDNSVVGDELLEIQPNNSTTYKNGSNITFDIARSDAWLLPSQSRFYIEGRLVKNDGTPYTKDTQGNFPDIVLVNNFFPFLFSNIKYKINGEAIEDINNPAYPSLLKNLLTYSAKDRLLNQCWGLDTYDGQTDSDVLYDSLPRFTDADFEIAGATPTKAEYIKAMKLIILAFVTTNGVIIDNPPDTDFPCAGANPTSFEMLQAFQLVINKLNTSINAPEIPPIGPGDIPDNTSVTFRNAFNSQIRLINLTLMNTDPSLSKNEGYWARKRCIFNKFGAIIPQEEAGRFSFTIPLSSMFNFCDDYTGLLWNCDHKVELIRGTTDDIALFKNKFVTTPGRIDIDKIIWYVPQKILTIDGQLKLKQSAVSTKKDITYRARKYEDGDISAFAKDLTVTYNDGGYTEAPKYILAAFKFIPTGSRTDEINSSIFVNPMGNSLTVLNITRIDLMVGGKVVATQVGDNDSTLNRYAKYYDNFKRLRKVYTGIDDESNCIDYQDYLNLYRIYAFDISRTTHDFTQSTCNLSIKFTFSRATPSSDSGIYHYHIIKFYDKTYQADLLKLADFRSF